MRANYLIYKNSGDGMLHAGFIIGKADSKNIIDKPAVLCMENKKVRLDFCKKY